ncbi:DUF2804 domain-containing protein [Nocardiopsis sp. HNM0947]|uniref:DUF2804 domain-containing protein n=1 Tax=Nocardiopsis coralli TaxID=2772213 RepID=A0ABR9P6U4_9ACTN|nr:DUF2804 domain-containing protein [Nocardiopsis coralli]MBE2999539.1 DUF2804 domain-containing protein [Nocardiopsis coralli]
MPTHEHEITAPVDLCTPDGHLNPDAVGWSRTPLHRTHLTGSHLAGSGWGRNKRWEYWLVSTPTHSIALTLADIDYLGLASVHFLEHGDPGDRGDRGSRNAEGVHGAHGDSPGARPPRELTRTALRPLAHGVHLPPSLGSGPAASLGPIRARIRDTAHGTRLRFSCITERGPLSADLTVDLPPGHETMNVVIPWSPTRFQYTSKHTARPARGTVRLAGNDIAFTDAWGVLDHGRGRWPYDTRWNWGAAAGRTDGRVLGLQFGGTWTRGTGLTENALCVDGRLHKIGEELDWDYDLAHPMEPWRLHVPGSDRVELTFTPFHERSETTDAGILVNDTTQCFGHYDGTVRTDDGRTIAVHALPGFAEDVHMRW